MTDAIKNLVTKIGNEGRCKGEQNLQKMPMKKPSSMFQRCSSEVPTKFTLTSFTFNRQSLIHYLNRKRRTKLYGTKLFFYSTYTILFDKQNCSFFEKQCVAVKVVLSRICVCMVRINKLT